MKSYTTLGVKFIYLKNSQNGLHAIIEEKAERKEARRTSEKKVKTPN